MPDFKHCFSLALLSCLGAQARSGLPMHYADARAETIHFIARQVNDGFEMIDIGSRVRADCDGPANDFSWP